MADLSEVDKYNIVCVALYFVTFVVSLLLSIWLLCFLRRRSDPARLWLPWLNSAFALYTLYLVLLFIAFAISVISSGLIARGTEIPKDVQQNATLARAFIISIYWLLRNIIQICILMLLVTLDNGISISRGGNPISAGKYLRRSALALSVCLILISAISFGLRCAVYAQQYSGNDIDYYRLANVLIERWLLVKRINFSYCVVWEVIAVALFGLATWSRLLASDVPHTKKASTYAVISSALLVTQTTFDIITYIKTVNFQNTKTDDVYAPYLEVLDIIFNIWTWFAILCTLLSLSNKKIGGVWSTDQPFTTRPDKDKMVQTAWGYGAYCSGGSGEDQSQTGYYDANGNPWTWPTGGQYYSHGQQHHVQYGYGQGQGATEHVEMTGQPPYQQPQQQQQMQQVHQAQQAHQAFQQQQYYSRYQTLPQPAPQPRQEPQPPQYPPNMYMVT